MRQIVFPSFYLFVGENIIELFEYFTTNQLDYLTHKIDGIDVLTPLNESIDVFSGQHPEHCIKTPQKPFIYVNTKLLNEKPIFEASINIMSECSKLACLMDDKQTNQTIISLTPNQRAYAEKLAFDVCVELGYPDVFYHIC
jgi:hypothetical protein